MIKKVAVTWDKIEYCMGIAIDSEQQACTIGTILAQERLYLAFANNYNKGETMYWRFLLYRFSFDGYIKDVFGFALQKKTSTGGRKTPLKTKKKKKRHNTLSGICTRRYICHRIWL